MKIWIFRNTSERRIYQVTEVKEGLKVMQGPQQSLITTWSYIDELKNQGKLEYLTTIRSLKPSNEFFKEELYV
ncbi:MAG: hypothetical protein E7I48_09935 [Clostridium celatum]|nr:hypothetical protein [Clostridium celatum]